ncbi:hypothetical protein CXB51_018274 [Gossypium anomalum]|uniref:Uncharacterized protein n=1 Tax=Gossypium anomalum TaxID=47600 RepID=A0A8J6CXB0_9ROSI|nr:hypothetical protein CXB51_018274 [Gossypium anomalum]
MANHIDVITNIMNVIVPPLMLIVLLLVYPLYLIYKFINFITRLLTSENVAGKVVLVTGAAAGIGEQISYEYARRGARLVLVDVRGDLLGSVVENVRSFGSPDLMFPRKKIARDLLMKQSSIFIDDVNLWGVAYGTYYAIPHLRKTKGKIVVMASSVGWYPFPRFSFYNASKAALITFYETLRTEIGNSNIGITIVTPGLVKSALSQNEPAKAALGWIPMESAEKCGKAIVKSACRGDKYVVEPSWVNSLFALKVMCPDLVRVEFPTCKTATLRKVVDLESHEISLVLQILRNWLPSQRIIFPKEAMDLADKLMNVIVITISLVALFFLHQYRFLNSLISTARTLFKENLTGKVVLITGASSGIGEHLAYEYARRGARLALVARRKQRLQEVADVCEIIGSPETVYILGDVSNIDDCKRFIDATVNHFGQLDHLVANAGVAPVCLFEDYDDITKASPAIASKAALISFYETLRIEFGTRIGITIVTPGFIDTEMTEGKFLSKEGRLEVDREMRDVQVSLMPVESVEKCAKAIVESARRGDRYLTVPSWMETTILWKVFCPEIMDGWNRFMILGPGSSYRDSPSKKILDVAIKGISQWDPMTCALVFEEEEASIF